MTARVPAPESARTPTVAAVPRTGTSDLLRILGLVGAAVGLAGALVVAHLIQGALEIGVAVGVIALLLASSLVLHQATYLRVLTARESRRRNKAIRSARADNTGPR